MTFNKLSMSAAAAALDVLEPIAVMRMERLDNLRGQVTFRGEFTDPSAAAADAGDLTALPVEEPVPVVQVEDDEDLVAAVEAAGLEAVVHPRRSMFFGGVAAAIRRDDGSVGAAADARRESATGVS